jgi:O-methyltransferase
MKLPKLTPSDPGSVQNFVFPRFWYEPDRVALADLLQSAAGKAVPGVHFSDNLFTWGRNNSMLDDQPFMEAWKSNIDDEEANVAIVWRRYILACAAYHCVQLGGDFVECGCYTGDGVKTVIDYLGGTEFPRTFWAYDLFEHDPSELHHPMPKHGTDLCAYVQQKFASYPQVRVIKGRIPEVFAGASPDQIAYLHIDLNQAPAEVAALEALFDRVVPAGVIILDDYEWATAYRPQKLAEDPWFDARDYRVFPLPTGQGLLIKR